MLGLRERRLRRTREAFEKRIREKWDRHSKLHREICEGNPGHLRTYEMDEIIKELLQLKRISQILEWIEKGSEMGQDFPPGFLERPNSIQYPKYYRY